MSEHTTPPRGCRASIALNCPPSFGGAGGRRYVPLAELAHARYDASGVLLREIWKYRDVESHRDVAVKLIPTAGRGELRAHVERGGAALTADAPGVAVMLDHVLVAEGTRGERLALISQFVVGSRLDELGSSPPERVRQLATALVGTVAALHAGGVVHGDIKPSNVIVRSSDGEPILIDAGSARRAGQRLLASSRLWEPPEAGADPIATTAYDCWSLGLLIAALLGFRPAPNETPDARGRRAVELASGHLGASVAALLRPAPTRVGAAEAHVLLAALPTRRGRWRLR
jgi:serine/threonine protein kinase